jgi:hypothetical protein
MCSTPGMNSPKKSSANDDKLKVLGFPGKYNKDSIVNTSDEEAKAMNEGISEEP